MPLQTTFSGVFFQYKSIICYISISCLLWHNNLERVSHVAHSAWIIFAKFKLGQRRRFWAPKFFYTSHCCYVSKQWWLKGDWGGKQAKFRTFCPCIIRGRTDELSKSVFKVPTIGPNLLYILAGDRCTGWDSRSIEWAELYSILNLWRTIEWSSPITKFVLGFQFAALFWNHGAWKSKIEEKFRTFWHPTKFSGRMSEIGPSHWCTFDGCLVDYVYMSAVKKV